jgi:hypothetical protein
MKMKSTISPMFLAPSTALEGSIGCRIQPEKAELGHVPADGMVSAPAAAAVAAAAAALWLHVNSCIY